MRPEILRGRTVKQKGNCGNIYATVNSNDNVPCEVLIRIGKAGGCASAMGEAIGRLLSRALAGGDNAADLADCLAGISCFSGRASCPDCIAIALRRVAEEKRQDDPDPENS